MKFLTRKLVTPADLNPRGTLHGGQLLKWIDEEGGIHAALELGAYKQMPYEEITEKEYKKMVDSLSFLSFRQVKGNEAEVDKFCNNDTCEIDLEAIKETQELENA